MAKEKRYIRQPAYALGFEGSAVDDPGGAELRTTPLGLHKREVVWMSLKWCLDEHLG
jgi:hypothetical protein